MELDHLFVFVPLGGGLLRNRLAEAGLVETYTRAHRGQGTANVCYAFDNAFLELIWLTNEAEATSPRIHRTRLWERSQWEDRGTCPFGIAWRGKSTLPTWDFKPPYLPDGMCIPVSTLSDDPEQPMLFQSPGTEPPIQWPASRQGGRQTAGGFTRMAIELDVPGEVHPTLKTLALDGLRLRCGSTWRATLDLGNAKVGLL